MDIRSARVTGTARLRRRSSIPRVVRARGGVRESERHARERAIATLARIGLEQTANDMVVDPPSGQRKLIGRARTLMNDGPLLLLDEPMAEVEGAAYETMQRVVRDEAEAEAGRAVCVVEHNVSLIRCCSTNHRPGLHRSPCATS
jgi:ABC-type branched-subunit amino acid transport system ATPase component